VGPSSPFHNIKKGSYAAPTFNDLDFDGDQDMVVGSFMPFYMPVEATYIPKVAAANSMLTFYRNTGTGQKAVYVEEAQVPSNPFSTMQWKESRVRPSFVDLNFDGRLDVIVGVGTASTASGSSSKVSCSESWTTPEMCGSIGNIYMELNITAEPSKSNCKAKCDTEGSRIASMSSMPKGCCGVNLTPGTTSWCRFYPDVITTRKPTETACNEALIGMKAAGYRGCQNKTISGRTCQRWDVESPHSHGSVPYPVKYPNSGLTGNYCRNPTAIDYGTSTIWCYTTDSAVEWELCDPLSLPTPVTLTATESNFAQCVAQSMSTSKCEDTPDFTNGQGYGCASYEANWCADGAAKVGSELKLGTDFNFPEHNCCVCGKLKSTNITVECQAPFPKGRYVSVSAVNKENSLGSGTSLKLCDIDVYPYKTVPHPCRRGYRTSWVPATGAYFKTQLHDTGHSSKVKAMLECAKTRHDRRSICYGIRACDSVGSSTCYWKLSLGPVSPSPETEQMHESFTYWSMPNPKAPNETQTSQNVPLGVVQARTSSARGSPSFGDVDGDGDQDMLFGDNFGRLNFLENIGNKTHHKFVYVDRHTRPPYPICANHSFSSPSDPNNLYQIQLPGATSPVFVDLDNDGNLDVVVGSSADMSVPLRWFRNTGRRRALGHFEDVPKSKNPFAGVVIDSANVIPAFFDIDGDGDQDLIASAGVGSNGGKLLFYKNFATETFCYFQGSFSLATGRCMCSAGFAGVQCEKKCPGSVPAVCFGHGACYQSGVRAGSCLCDTGYGGQDGRNNTACNDCIQATSNTEPSYYGAGTHGAGGISTVGLSCTICPGGPNANANANANPKHNPNPNPNPNPDSNPT